MSFRIADFEHRKALMACFREIQDDDGNEYFTVQDDAYGYNADSQCVFVMLESNWEGYSLAVVCPTYSDAKFVVTDDETGEEYHYSTREKLMDEEFLVKPWCYEDNKNAVCGCFEPCRLPDEESDEEDEEEEEEDEGEWCSAECEENEGCRKCNPFAFQTAEEMAAYLNNKL